MGVEACGWVGGEGRLLYAKHFMDCVAGMMRACVVGGFQSLWIAKGRDGICRWGIVERWLVRLVAGESLKRTSETRVADSWSFGKSKRGSASERRH